MNRGHRVTLAIIAAALSVPVLALALFRAWAVDQIAHDSPQTGGPVAVVDGPIEAPPLEFLSEDTHNEFTRRAIEAAQRALEQVQQEQVRAQREADERGLGWPVIGRITSPFGPRGDGYHHGVDIGCALGVPIRAASAGHVTWSEPARVYGNTVALDHGNGVTTLYAHMSRIDVVRGEFVTRGEQIGLCGSTGHSTGPHLHFEVRRGGLVHDPLTFLPR